MENNFEDRIKKIKAIKSKEKDDESDIKLGKVLGEGVEGKVYLVNIDDYDVALKVNDVLNKNNIKPKSLSQQQMLSAEGVSEFFASRLINILIDEKINPHFVYNYKSYISKSNKLFSLNEFIKSESLRKFLSQMKKKKLLTKELVFNIFFQILVALHSLQKNFGMIHADLHFENILIAKVDAKKDEYWEYIINGKKYYLPNLGYQIYLNDYGYAMIPDVLGKTWYVNFFRNITNTNKYNLYDLLLVRFEMLKYFGPHFNKFFFKYFNYQETDEYLKKSDIPFFPQDLDVLDIIELLFSKNDVSNCKDFEWYCFDNEKPPNDKIIESYNLDKAIEIDKITKALTRRISIK